MDLMSQTTYNTKVKGGNFKKHLSSISSKKTSVTSVACLGTSAVHPLPTQHRMMLFIAYNSHPSTKFLAFRYNRFYRPMRNCQISCQARPFVRRVNAWHAYEHAITRIWKWTCAKNIHLWWKIVIGRTLTTRNQGERRMKLTSKRQNRRFLVVGKQAGCRFISIGVRRR